MGGGTLADGDSEGEGAQGDDPPLGQRGGGVVVQVRRLPLEERWRVGGARPPKWNLPAGSGTSPGGTFGCSWVTGPANSL